MDNKTVDFAIALNHLKSGGAIRRKCWKNECKVALWKSNKSVYYMPDKANGGWLWFEGFETDDIMADDWELAIGDIEDER